MHAEDTLPAVVGKDTRAGEARGASQTPEGGAGRREPGQPRQRIRRKRRGDMGGAQRLAENRDPTIVQGALKRRAVGGGDPRAVSFEKPAVVRARACQRRVRSARNDPSAKRTESERSSEEDCAEDAAADGHGDAGARNAAVAATVRAGQGSTVCVDPRAGVIISLHEG